MPHRVFTVGQKDTYDRGIKELGERFRKIGRKEDYPGGFAVSSIADARRLIREFEKEGIWGVYELDAEWGVDTTPSENGWWHALLRDAVIRPVSKEELDAADA